MKIKIIGIVAIIYGLFIFLSYIPQPSFSEVDSEEETNTAGHVYYHQIRLPFEKWVKKNLNLEPGGNPGSKINEKVECIGLSFNATRRVTIKEARALMLTLLDKLMEMTNSDEKIRPYLADYPFSHDRFNLRIRFTGINGCHPDGAIREVSYESPITDTYLSKAILIYYPQNSDYHSYQEGVESYKRAVERNASFPKEYLTVHRGEPYEEDIDQFLCTFSKELAKECKIWRWSIGGKMNQQIEEIIGEYNAFYPASKEEARELGMFVTQKLLKDINNNEKLRPYLEEYPFPIERVKMRILFTNEKYTPYTDISMNSIVLEGNNITYFQDIRYPDFPDPYDEGRVKTEMVGQESYQEALHIVEEIPADKRKYRENFTF